MKAGYNGTNDLSIIKFFKCLAKECAHMTDEFIGRKLHRQLALN